MSQISKGDVDIQRIHLPSGSSTLMDALLSTTADLLERSAVTSSAVKSVLEPCTSTSLAIDDSKDRYFSITTATGENNDPRVLAANEAQKLGFTILSFYSVNATDTSPSVLPEQISEQLLQHEAVDTNVVFVTKYTKSGLHRVLSGIELLLIEDDPQYYHKLAATTIDDSNNVNTLDMALLQHREDMTYNPEFLQPAPATYLRILWQEASRAQQVLAQLDF